MVVAPFLEEIVTHISSIAEDEASEPASKEVEVRVETARGRYLGVTPVLLIDLVWSMSTWFKKVQSLRVAGGWETLRITFDGTLARPVARAAFEASELWVLEHGEGDPFLDYVTADEMVPDVVDQPYGPGDGGAGADQADLVRQLQARIVELEAQRGGAGGSVAPVQPPRTSRELFPAEQGQPADAAMMERLRGLAGPSPARLGRLEATHRFGATPKMAAAPVHHAEAEHQAGAVEEEEIEGLTAQLTDPLQQLIALQVKQTSALMSRLAPRQSSDPLANVLAGSGNDGGSSGGSGVKGCAAREVFLRQIEDNSMVGRLVLQNAQRELGIADAAVHPGLMRDYLEKKMPLGDMKLLTFMGAYLSHAWEAAYIAKDELMLGYIARGLLFVEQAALDSGKTTMAWLLTGLPEPNWSATSLNRRRQGLQPFARLSQASWAAANVSYLRDLDFMETKMRAVGGKGNKGHEETGDDPPTDKPTRRPWQGKKRGSNKNKETGTEEN